MNSRNLITEKEMLALLKEGQFQFPPFQITGIRTGPTASAKSRNAELDALLTLTWQGRAYRFGAEVGRLWTPKVVAQTVETVRRYAGAAGVKPLIVVPYLDEEKIRMLEAEGVSGIDLCGNGIVVVPGELLVMRTGLPNRFRWESAIKNVYRKNSSVVARVFLLVPQFDSVKDALKEIRQRGGEVTMATVSKVCKRLEEDLVLERVQGESPVMRRLRLLQPQKLLDLLAENYELPVVVRTFRGKCSLPPDELRNRLCRWQAKSGKKVIQTGASSVEAYAVMAREPVQSYYCSDLKNLLQSLGDDVRETERFENVVFLEPRDDVVYFDGRPGLVASPIQTYLELINGDIRQRETADQLRRVILTPLTPRSRKG